MKVLAIETSTLQGSVAVVSDGVVLAAATHDAANAHAEALMALIETVLQEAHCRKEQLDRVAVGVGPGSFTGLRVGIALAQGIALGLEIPVVGVGSLEALANACTEPDAVRVPVVDARRGEVFATVVDPLGQRLCPPQALSATNLEAQLAALTHGRAYVAVGTAARGLLPDRVVRDSGRSAYPHAADTGLLASIERNHLEAVPQYVRDADAIKPQLAPNPLVQGVSAASENH